VQFHVHQSVPAGVIHGATVVTLLDVLHHIPEDEKRPVIRQIIADLPPGARLIIKDLDPKPAWRALANRVTDYLSTRSKVSYIALADVVAILQESGLKIRVAKRCNRHVWSHFFVVADKVSA
jgi:2-polyprenyl-3-methyl-5-hydroxy-6-metoxy-1,4-benzoquinol methylase